MLRIFDDLYYAIYKFYSPKERGATATAALAVGGLQAANVFAIWMFGLWLNIAFVPLSKGLGLAVLLFFQVLSYIRYVYKEKVNIEKMDTEYETASDNFRIRVRVIRFTYLILTGVFILGSAILLGSTK